MCLKRRVLAELDTNITPRKDLSPFVRGIIVGQALEGRKPARIAKELNIPDSTVRDTIEKTLLRNDGFSKPRSGRPDKYSERFKRRLVLFIRKEPKSSMARIRKAM